jgi:hypothetical protein
MTFVLLNLHESSEFGKYPSLDSLRVAGQCLKVISRACRVRRKVPGLSMPPQSKFVHLDSVSFLISCLVDGDLNKALGLANAGPMYTNKDGVQSGCRMFNVSASRISVFTTEVVYHCQCSVPASQRGSCFRIP